MKKTMRSQTFCYVSKRISAKTRFRNSHSLIYENVELIDILFSSFPFLFLLPGIAHFVFFITDSIAQTLRSL